MSKYSVILPVRNGGKYVKECVNSILSQSFREFELIVLENCSTDDTLQIISSFNDERIKIYPADKPLTIEENWQRIVSIGKKEFSTIIGHDDILDKNYLLTIDGLIHKHPHASLYQTHFRYIDSVGKEIGKCQPMTDVLEPMEVVHSFLCNRIDIMGTGFMSRSKDYDEVGGIPSYPNLLFADMELWIKLSIKGYLAVEQSECFSYRKHSSATTSISSDAKFLQSVDQFVQYLYDLENGYPFLASVIKSDSSQFLKQYCQGITHKVLRTPKKMRQTSGVKDIIDQFREYAKKLGNDKFEPLNFKKIQMGKLIDENFILHSLFLMGKKIYSKPIVKN